jgi:hypothetical protein
VITNTGKVILAKYLIDQAPSYAAYIALGVGPRPLASGQSFEDYSEKESLDFEVLRVPIVSKGFVYDQQGNPNIVFIGDIPTDQRYAITEIGIFPGLSNPTAGTLDSKIVYSFSESENWEFHTENASLSIEAVVAPLNLEEASGVIAVPNIAFRVNSNNVVFSGPLRAGIFERPRFLDRSLLLRGDMSFLSSDGNSLSIVQDPNTYFGSHIHLNGTSLNFDANSPDDELRLAFSVMAKDDIQQQQPGSVRVLIEFADADVAAPTSFARFELEVNQSDPGVNFALNRYFVATKKFSELVKSPNFTWSSVTSVRIYTTVIESGGSQPSDNFYVCLDGFRFENTTIKNPLYGLTGYSVIRNSSGRPIIKEPNTSSSVEFRFGLDID